MGKKVLNFLSMLPISDKNYDEALDYIEELMSSESKEDTLILEILSIYVEKYEDERFPMEDSDPVEVIKLVMDQQNMTKGDLAKVIDSNSRVSEILKRKRGLSIHQIRSLHRKLNIPAGILIKDYELSK